MNVFTSKTKNVNKDRKYFTTKDTFIKADFNRKRSAKEAVVQREMSCLSYAVPKVLRTFDIMVDGKNCAAIEMEKVSGSTLENLYPTLNKLDKHKITTELFRIISAFMGGGYVHGDINNSNVMFDKAGNKRVFIVDFEMARKESSFVDIYGPPWGLIYLLKRLK